MLKVPFSIANYDIKTWINSGSFGDIYLAEERSNKYPVAVKMENKKTVQPLLIHESKVYNHLAGGEGIPKIRWNGNYLNYNVMIMDLLGLSLEQLHEYCSRKFSLKTVLMLVDQMIKLMQYTHNKDILHRDIKPDNFLCGTGPRMHLVHLIDFGLAKKFQDTRKNIHIELKSGKSMTGTARYCSINVHNGLEQSRRDDMEALCYVWIYFLKGSLPWQGLKVPHKSERNKAIGERKKGIPVASLCQGLPDEFGKYLLTVRNLEFKEMPPYDDLRDMFKKLFVTRGFKYDNEYDWIILNRKSRNKV